MAFRSRLWRPEDACRAVVFGGLLFVAQRGMGALDVAGPSALVAAVIVIVVVPLLFLPEATSVSVAQDQVTFEARGLIRRRTRQHWVPRTVVSSLFIGSRGGILRDEAGRRRLGIGSGWTDDQYRELAARLGIPAYDHRAAWGLAQRKAGRLLAGTREAGPRLSR